MALFLPYANNFFYGVIAEIFTIIPVRTSRNFFRLGSAFLEGEMAEPSLKKLREVRTQLG